jgi:hypothetical protein
MVVVNFSSIVVVFNGFQASTLRQTIFLHTQFHCKVSLIVVVLLRCLLVDFFNIFSVDNESLIPINVFTCHIIL